MLIRSHCFFSLFFFLSRKNISPHVEKPFVCLTVGASRGKASFDVVRSSALHLLCCVVFLVALGCFSVSTWLVPNIYLSFLPAGCTQSSAHSQEFDHGGLLAGA